jgi:putative heme-binding domain-containing protein
MLKNAEAVCRSHPITSRLLVLATLGLAGVLAFSQGSVAADNPVARVEILPGDHISFIGNTLADRMQHDGWLETLLQSRLSQHHLVFRDLGFSGDELSLRLRSSGFGSPDDWLAANKTDVVFAFFGYNESFAGAEGLAKFKKDLADLIQHTLGQKYNGKSAPRLVLFSPIAHEDLHSRNLPDGKASNERLALYTAAMAEVAQRNRVPFVDLFNGTRDEYARESEPLTINGVHLNEHGNWIVARLIDRALFPGKPEPTQDPQSFARLRQAVLDKNFYWFNRYRTLDGFNVYGGRSYERYAEGQTNRVVLQREMQVLDVMTANRDQRIWAVAAGGDRKVDDSNTPPFIPTKTNFPGPLPGGKHVFLDGEEAITKMTVATGMKVNLFASEKQFPELAKPVQMAFDGRGRLWVAVWPSYPHWKPKEEMNDKILVFEDTRGDGKADKCTVFADHLHCPTGFAFYNGGVLVAQAPGVLFLKDTRGTGKADLRVRVLEGIDSADTHHTANSFAVDPGGAVYFQEGTFHHTQVETPYGPPERCVNAGVFRYEPRTQKFDVYITYAFANPHGHVFNRWGQDIVYDGTGANPYDAALISGHLDFPLKHPGAPQVYQQRTRPCPGVEILSSRHFPEANQGNLLVGNVIGFQGILQYRVEDNGSSLKGTEIEPILSSTDRNFRPSDLKIGPDGAIYFIDWYNPIIGHLQHHLRDPNRDRTHGRIYRVTYEGRPLLKPARIAGEPIEKLLDLLKEPEDRVRERARLELGARDSDQVMAALQQWVAGLDKNDPAYEHHLLEALWLHQSHNVVNLSLLKRMLESPEFHARAAATRVLCYWRDRVPDALELLEKLAADPQPRVRLEAVRAASFFQTPDAVEVPLVSTEHPTDLSLDYVREETMRALEPYWKKAIAQGKEIRFSSPVAARFLLGKVSTDDLVKMKRDRAVCVELLSRKGIRDEYRRDALTRLAGLEKLSETTVLQNAIRNDEASKTSAQPIPEDDSVRFDLVRLLVDRGPAELTGVRAELERMATSARLPISRQLGYVALVAADGTVDRAWELARKSASGLLDLVNAMPLIRDPSQRASLYPRVEPLLDGLPGQLAGAARGAKPVLGRYVRIELPGRRRTLTLAEVEVYSGGRNIAGDGKASQKNTAYGGTAGKAIDGNTSGDYGAGGQTHTWENTSNPWWQVDLGSEFPIRSIRIYNRTDGDLGKRLEGFTLKVLDGEGKVVFQRDKQPAPEVDVSYQIGEEGVEWSLRQAAMYALASVRGQEEKTFNKLAAFVLRDRDRPIAVGALLRIPSTYWPKEEVKPLLDNILASIRKLPAQERTTPAARDELQLGDQLAALLPLAEAKPARQELGELGVPILRLGTVPDQMLFDKDRLVVKAGKQVEFVFENNDLMPHNFVITQPGSLEEIGLLAEATATEPGAAERNYVPSSNKILLASRLLRPREGQRLSFTVPSRPGVYPYVCTYPGHWRRMYGALYVIEDLDQYRADAEAYLAKNPLPIADELLKFNRPRKEWRFEELAAAVEQLDHGRSFGNGKQMFQVANCVACHKLNGVGNQIGPDLAQLDPKLKPVDVWRDIVDPSFRINEKYNTYIFETQSGRVVTGLVVEENKDVVKVLENPLVKSEPVVLKQSEIAERKKSPTSIMPRGLLDKLTREEILDLVAYVFARGDAGHAIFQGQHDHAHAGGH